MIPAGIELSPEDEQAVRMRTGCVNPLSNNELVFIDAVLTAHQVKRDEKQVQDVCDTNVGKSGNGKRKASEVLREDILDAVR